MAGDADAPEPTPLERPRAAARDGASTAGRVTAPTADPSQPGETRPLLGAGERLGRYVVDELLAHGGMGVVYRATDPVLGRAVALKLIRVRDDRGGGRARDRLVREAQALARLSHPNVIAVHDAGTTDAGEVFIAMELVPGQTLAAWRRAAPRSIRAIMERLLAAGRGLVAAHAAGLVHRDVKPDNIIVGDDQRVRVIDFGLARPRDGGRTEATTPDPDLAAPEGLDEVRLTATGSLMGTPAYMAPEQHRNPSSDELGDQYAFCASAWETLYGTLPFAARNLAELLADKERMRLTPTPPDARIPARLRRVLVRGLSPAPADRFPSMEALLAALTRALAAPRRRALTAMAATAAAGLIAAAVAWPSRGAIDPCSTAGDPDQHLSGIWDAQVQAGIHQTFVRTGRPHAAATAERVRVALDGYARDWLAMRADSCRATHVRLDQSAELLDLRTACLDRRRVELAALTALLADGADGMVVDRAVEGVLGLVPLSRCADTEQLRGQPPLPSDADLRAHLGALRARLSEAVALTAVAQYEAAGALAEPLLAEARALGFEPLLAEVLVVVAELHHRAGRTAEAITALREVVQVAAVARDEHLVARALVDLTWLIGYRQSQPRTALAMAPGAEAAIARAGDVPWLRARLANSVGLSQILLGNYADAEQTLRAELGRHAREGDTALDLVLAQLQNTLGHVLLSTGRLPEARAAFERAVAMREALQGDDHPDTATIRGNLAVILLEQGELDAAGAAFARVLATAEATHGPEHPQVALSLSNVGVTLHRQGRHAEARPYLERAAAIQRQAFGEDHRDLALTLVNLGAALAGEGDARAAVEQYEAALRILERVHSPTHPDLAHPLRGLADALLTSDQPAAALAAFQRALGLQEAAGTDASAEGAESWSGIGAAQLALGRYAEAEVALRRSVALRDTVATLPAEAARTRFLLGRAVWERGRDRAGALELIDAARGQVAELTDPRATKLRAEIDAWRTRHRR